MKESKFESFCSDLKAKKWIVYSKPPLNSAKNVFIYLGRYTHRVALSNSRIVDFKDGKVTFRKDYSDHNKLKLMTFDAYEFIRRFLLHVLPFGFTKIRYYGILSSRNLKTKLQKCKMLLGVLEENQEQLTLKETWQERLLKLTGVDITKCPLCKKGTLKITKDIPTTSKSVV